MIADIHYVRVVRALNIVIVELIVMVVDPLKFGLGSEVERLRGVAVKLWNEHKMLISEVAGFHKANTPGNYQSLAYKRFYVRGSSLYFSFKHFLRDNAELSDGEFLDAVWLRMIDEVRVVRRVRGGGSDSHSSLFVREFCARYGYDSRDEVMARRVRNAYLVYLSWVMGGVLFERQVFSKLVERYGALAVRYGSEADESADVDLWLGDVPVSVKCDTGFSVSNLDRYRYAQGKNVPELYVNEDLAVMFPGDGPGGWELGDVDDLDIHCGLMDLSPVPVEDLWADEEELESIAEVYGSAAAYLRAVE